MSAARPFDSSDSKSSFLISAVDKPPAPPVAFVHALLLVSRHPSPQPVPQPQGPRSGYQGIRTGTHTNYIGTLGTRGGIHIYT